MSVKVKMFHLPVELADALKEESKISDMTQVDVVIQALWKYIRAQDEMRNESFDLGNNLPIVGEGDGK